MRRRLYKAGNPVDNLLDTSCVLYLDAMNGLAASGWKDFSARQNNSLLGNNPTIKSDCLRLNGTNQYVRTSKPLVDQNCMFTVELTFSNYGSTSDVILFAVEGHTIRGAGYYTFVEKNARVNTARNGGANTSGGYNQSEAPMFGSNTHVVTLQTKGANNIYFDGEKQSISYSYGGASDGYAEAGWHFGIGMDTGRIGNISTYAKLDVHSCIVWNRPLSDDEIYKHARYSINKFKL